MNVEHFNWPWMVVCLVCTIFIFHLVHSYCIPVSTRETHARHISNLSDPLLATSVATTYGLSRDSILNSLQCFHVAEGLPPDIMHDILEGALQYEVKEMLRQFTGEKDCFSLSFLNSIISKFPYHYSDARNKPALIALHTKDNKVNQEGTHMYVVKCGLSQLLAMKGVLLNT